MNQTMDRDIYLYTEHVKNLEKRLNNKNISDERKEQIKTEIIKFKNSIKAMKGTL